MATSSSCLAALPAPSSSATLPNPPPQHGPNPDGARCDFWLAQKGRHCKMQKMGSGQQYCGEHINNATTCGARRRVPCPLDPKHTVFEDLLARHVAKCNARPKAAAVPYFRQGINLPGGGGGGVERRVMEGVKGGGGSAGDAPARTPGDAAHPSLQGGDDGGGGGGGGEKTAHDHPHPDPDPDHAALKLSAVAPQELQALVARVLDKCAPAPRPRRPA